MSEQPGAGDACSARVVDYFPPEVEQLVATAMRAIDAHVNDRGCCAGCRLSWPCATAVLAEHNLAAL